MIEMRKDRALGYLAYEPTPKAIRRACEEIQATWSPRERAKRKRGPRAPWWSPSMIRLSDLVEAINGEWSDGPPYAGAAGREAER
jgi:hypothetical protein